MGRKRVCIIYTGGTLGMRPSAHGYAPADDLESLIRERVPELGADSMPEYVLVQYDEPVDSANATPVFWHRLAGQIHQAGDEFDGFVVIHGTDTMAYTASALSFLLAGFTKPIILTGSQIPLVEVRNDAQSNMISANQLIASGRPAEVAICFGPLVLRGNRSTKMRSTELDAFQSPNCLPLVEIGAQFTFVEHADLPPRLPEIPDAPPPFHDCNIATLRVFPGMQGRLINAIVDAGAAGIVLRCYGVGTAPVTDRHFLNALLRASDAGVVIVAVSQCLEGSVWLRRYAAGSALADTGVVSGYDMTTEAACTKLHALFAMGLDRARVSTLMQKNLCGELTASV